MATKIPTETSISMEKWTVGENVLIDSDEHGKKIVGSIEELDDNSGTFTYTLLVNSKESLQSEYYHGEYELFKTNTTYSEKISSILKCVEVLKFKDYVMREPPTQQQPFYVLRQYLDISEGTLTPSELKPCVCGKIVNPDGNVVMCLHCNDLFYHDKCLVAGTKCSGCGAVLKENQLSLKRTASEADLPDLNTLQSNKGMSDIIEEEVETEEIEPSRNHINTDEIKSMFEAAKIAKQKQQELRRKQLAQSRSLQQQQENTRPGSLQNANSNKPVLLKKESSIQLEFNNLTASQNDKIQSLVTRYKKFNPTANLNGPDKKRMEVREKFFEYIVYGLQEFELNELSLTEDETKIATQDAYEVARKLAVEIESNVFSINNRSNKYALTENYKQRCKLLFMNLRDPLNFYLRRRIINKTLKPQMLCTLSEMELYNPTKLKEIQDQKMKILERDTINLADQQKFILKTNKGEEFVDLNEDKYVNSEENEMQSEETPTKENRNKSNGSINKASSMENEDGDNYNNSTNGLGQMNGSVSSLDERSNLKVIKNSEADNAIIQALLNFVGEKQIKRMQDRLLSDLPEKEAKYLVKKLIA